MGENEQGGMLRVVVVVGLIAIIAAVVIFGVTGLKNSASDARNSGVTAIKTAYNPDYGENLLDTSVRNQTFSAGTDPSVYTYNFMYYRIEPLDPGQTYTFSANVSLQHTSQNRVTLAVYDWQTTESYAVANSFKADGTRDSWTFTVPTKIKSSKACLLVYAGASGNTHGVTASYTNMKLEKGSEATD